MLVLQTVMLVIGIIFGLMGASVIYAAISSLFADPSEPTFIVNDDGGHAESYAALVFGTIFAAMGTTSLFIAYRLKKESHLHLNSHNDVY